MKPLPNTAAVTQTLIIVEECNRRLAGLRAEEKSLTATLAEVIEKGEDVSAVRMQEIAGQEVRLKMLPAIIAKREAEGVGAVAELVAAVEKLWREMGAHANAEREELLDKIEGVLKPFAPDFTGQDGKVTNVARGIAGQCPVVAYLGAVPNLPELCFNQLMQAETTSAVSRASRLVAVCAEVGKRGSWITVPHPAAAK